MIITKQKNRVHIQTVAIVSVRHRTIMGLKNVGEICVVLFSTVLLIVFKPAPTQASVGPPTMPNTSGAPVSGSPSVPAGQCKVPGCTKPCYAEKGRIYEFCGRTHADHYSKLMMQQGPHPTPTATKAPPSNQQSMITNAPGIAPYKMQFITDCNFSF